MNSKSKKKVSIIRRFNRYYTNVLGLLDQYILKSKFSLSEVRILHEIENMSNCTSKKLVELLCLDSGYLSRLIGQFQKCGLIEKRQSNEDRRLQVLYLTPIGKQKMDVLNASSDEQIYSLIQNLSEETQDKLVQNMVSIESILTLNQNIKLEDISIRHQIRPGDAGYITYMHGWIYKKEYNYTTAFEAYVAQSFYDFLLNYNINKDRLWVAEHNNEIIGCIGVVGHGCRAQLRWFLLHPNYRGIGLGKSLLNNALAFCREKNYIVAYLDTTNDLETAINMYTKVGFIKVAEKENHTWSDELTELEFEMKL